MERCVVQPLGPFIPKGRGSHKRWVVAVSRPVLPSTFTDAQLLACLGACLIGCFLVWGMQALASRRDL